MMRGFACRKQARLRRIGPCGSLAVNDACGCVEKYSIGMSSIAGCVGETVKGFSGESYLRTPVV